MHFQEDQNKSKIRINSWDSGVLTINGKKHQENIIITDTEILSIALPKTVSKLTISDINNYCRLKPSVLLLGTGSKQQFPKREIMEAATSKNIAIEVMDTRAACRIFTLLVSEGRKVMAILFIDS